MAEEVHVEWQYFELHVKGGETSLGDSLNQTEIQFLGTTFRGPND